MEVLLMEQEQNLMLLDYLQKLERYFQDIVNPNDFIHDEWLPIPWWSDSIMRKDLAPYVYLSLPRERLYIWNINEESEQLFLTQ